MLNTTKIIAKRITAVLLAVLLLFSNLMVFASDGEESAENYTTYETLEAPVVDEQSESEPLVVEQTAEEQSSVEEPVIEDTPAEDSPEEQPTVNEPAEEEPIAAEQSEGSVYFEEDSPSDIEEKEELAVDEENDSELPAFLLLGAGSHSADELYINDYSLNDLYIYNYLSYLNSSNAVINHGTSASFVLYGDTTTADVVIGGQTSATGNAVPMSSNISVELNGFRQQKPTGSDTGPVFEVLDVFPYNPGSSTTNITVKDPSDGDNYIDTLIIDEDAVVKLTVNEDLAVDTLTIATDAVVTVEVASGKTFAVRSVTGAGSLILKGNGSVSVSEQIIVGTLQVNGASVSGTDGDVILAAVESAALTSGSVSTAALFGYSGTSTGEKTLELTYGSVTNVAAIGVEESNTNVQISVNKVSVTVSGTSSIYRDYTLTYDDNEGTELTPGADWPTTYRVKTDTSGNHTVVSGASLPEYIVTGYLFTGWCVGTDTTPVKTLPSTYEGDLVLHLNQSAGDVEITFDRNYEPDADSNDEPIPEQTTTATYTFGSAVTLTDPDRFGYDFLGWKVVGGTEEREFSAGTPDFTVQSSDLDDDGKATLQALWQKAGFPLKIQPMNGTVSGAVTDYEISVDGGTTWLSYAGLAAAYDTVNWDSTNEILSFTLSIEYGETLGAFFLRVFGEGSVYPSLRDTRTVAGGKTRFVSWQSVGGTTLSATSTFDLSSDTGALDTRLNGETLAHYQQGLMNSPFVLKAAFSSTLLYTLTTDSLANWSILVNGTVKTPDAEGKIENIPVGATVTYRRTASGTTSISSWYFMDTAPIRPVMRPYNAGDAFIYFDFTMPANDVTAEYTDPASVYIDIAVSSITLAQNYSYNGLTGLKGFWYDAAMTRVSYTATTGDTLPVNAMTPLCAADFDGDGTNEYFYEFNWTNTDFHITSCNEASQNQLTIIAATKGIYFCDVDLEATAAYLADVGATTIQGSNMTAFSTSIDYGAYGNIVLNAVNGAYTTNTYFMGNSNTVTGIFMDRFRAHTKTYQGLFHINGARGNKQQDSVRLGLVFGCMHGNVNNITIGECADASQYLFVYKVTSYDIINITDSTIDCAHKGIWGDCSSIYFNRSDVHIKSSFNGLNGDVRNSNVTIEENWEFGWGIFYAYGNSHIVVGGSLLLYPEYNTRSTVELTGDGYLIVKGAELELGRLTLYSGLIVANLLEVHYQCDFKGGTIIANQISGYLLSNSNRVRTYPYKANCFVGPFNTYSMPSQGNFLYSFAGSNIYLLGYYRTNGSSYDTTLTTLNDPDNPMKYVVNEFAANGISNLTGAAADAWLESNVFQTPECLACKDKECVTVGHPDFTSDTVYPRAVAVSGGTIKAAGNVTFWNDTTVTGGTVVCGGSFGCLRDLSISGGSITANEIGIAGAYTYTDPADRLLRYQLLTLSGGTLITDRLGSLSTPLVGQSFARGTVAVSGSGATVSSRSGAAVLLVDDLKANYVFDSAQFSKPDSAPEYFELSGTLNGSTLASLRSSITLSLSHPAVGTAATLDAPLLVGGTGTGDWCIDSLDGTVLSSVGADGRLNGQGADYLYEERNKAALYAVKSDYALTVAEGLSRIAALDYSGHDPSDLQKDNTVARGDTVRIQVNDRDDLYKLIVCYRDENGVLHNQLPSAANYDTVRNVVSFPMPAHDVEIYVTDEYKVHLNYTDIALTDEGFAVSVAADRPADSEFIYDGNVVIDQDNLTTRYVQAEKIVNRADNTEYTGETANRVVVESGGGTGFRGQLTSAPRTVTFQNVLMMRQAAFYQITVAEGEDAAFLIDGAVRLGMTSVPAGCDIRFAGKNGNSYKSTGQDVDALYFYEEIQGAYFGEVRFEDLTVSSTNSNGVIWGKNEKTTDGAVSFVDCHLSLGYGAYSSFVKYVNTVNLNDCVLDHPVEYTQTTGVAFVCAYLNITDSLIDDDKRTTGYIGELDLRSYLSINGAQITTLTDSTYYIRQGYPTRQSSSRLLYNGALVLKGDSQVTVQDHLYITNSLTMEDTSSVTVGGGSEEGYLFCPTVTVEDNASITTDYLLLSGIGKDYRADKTAADAYIQNASNLVAGTDSGLTVSDKAAVTADEFVGGNLGTNIHVNGGTLSSKVIGANGKVYGFISELPSASQPDCVAVYEPNNGIITDGPTIDITGGTVNVLDGGYLGGMNSTVTQTGGTVRLGSGAVYGMTGSQKTDLANYYSANGDSIANHTDTNVTLSISGGAVTTDGTGSIAAPYGTVTVSENSGDTTVRVQDLTAESGTVSISDAADGITNPYTGTGSNKSASVGVSVANELSAAELYILNGASVFADTAYSISDENGYIEVAEDALGSVPHTALYAQTSFGGQNGTGDCAMVTVHEEEEGGMKQNVYGPKRVQIVYDLCEAGLIADGFSALNSPLNPDGYTVGQLGTDGVSYYLDIQDASRYGYVFKGWYENAAYTGTKVTRILTTNSADIVLYAKWEPQTVDFTVSVDTNLIPTLYSENEAQGLSGSWSADNSAFTFSKVVSVPYGGTVLGAGTASDQVHLNDYDLNTYALTALVWRYGGYDYPVSTSADDPTTVDHIVLDAFLKGGSAPLTLYGRNKIKNRALIELNLNVVNGLPKSAAFPGGNSAYDSYGYNYVASYVDFGQAFVTGKGFDDGTGLIIQATAPGYSFLKWNSQADDSGTTITGAELVSLDTPSTLYAQWSANDYTLTFDAGFGAVVKTDDSEPVGGEMQTIEAMAKYDTVLNGNLTYTGDADTNLPTAWKKGYVFRGWSADGGTTMVKDTTKLNVDAFPNGALDVSNLSSSALTLTAVYEPVKITYYPNGGTWVSHGTGTAVYTDYNPVYGDPLVAYTKNAVASGVSELYGTDIAGANSYSVVSTLFDAYQTINGYVYDDYRHVIGRKGYTFLGWYTDPNSNTPVGTVPEYQDITLYAKWQANSYTLVLYDRRQNVNDTYVDFGHASLSSPSTVTNVTVGQEIPNSAAWPDRSDWYAYNKGTTPDDAAKRYLLGFSFDALDPGDNRSASIGYSTYISYAQAVTQLLNKQVVFTEAEGSTSGSIFSLPSDLAYSQYIGIDGIPAPVPDYPTGCVINMYAVYRERSLVFIEHITDVNGDTTDKVLASYPYNQYVNYDVQYPTDTNGNYSTYTANGYTLLKWGVNSYDINATQYTQTDYNANVESYKNAATSLGTFDINVYTIYAAQVTDDDAKQLLANSDPTAQNHDSYTYQVPGSMQTGYVRYLLSGSGYTDFAIVPKSELVLHEYDISYAHKIALTISIKDSHNTVKLAETDLPLTAVETSLGGVQVSAGDHVTLTMYHTRVMTADETETLSLQCKFYSNSNDVNSYLQQFFTLSNLQTVLTPSIYTIHYQALIPSVSYTLNITDYQGFGTDGLRTEATAYGAAILSAMPSIEGYDASAAWTRTDSAWTAYSPAESIPLSDSVLTIPVSEADNGNIYLQGDYTVHTYTLTLPSTVRADWTVTIDGNPVTVDPNDQVTVPYHANVVFTGRNADSYAEFIQVTETGKSMTELDFYGTVGTGNIYSFTMPAADVSTAFNRLRTLYLEDGTVTLNHETTPGIGYSQGAEPFRQWRGDYAILMNSSNDATNATANNLILSGDFADTSIPQSIHLGNLNLSSANSIELQANTTATLIASYGGVNSNITAQNIAVDSTSALTVPGGSGTKGVFTLTPAVGNAAIGGSIGGANGSIQLENLSIDMTLPAGSTASGIGSGSDSGTLTGCGTVTLTGCTITAEESFTASDAYAGAWIGGTAVPSVAVNDCTIDNRQTGASPVLGPYIVKGQTVSIKDSEIGQTNPVLDPIYAENDLTIDNSSISQQIKLPLSTVSAIGTGSSGTVTVKNGSSVNAEYQGSGSSNALYTGKLLLDDAASEVTINDVHILDVGNGDVTISQTGSSQTLLNSHSHTGDYLLIQEKTGYGDNAKLKVTGQTAGKKIMLNAMTLKEVKAEADTALKLEGDMTVTDAVDIKSSKTLSVTATGYTLTLTDGFISTSNHGNYAQTGGTLAGSNLCVAGDMTLDTVTCDADGGDVGSVGTAADATTVTLKDSTITAANIGAIGAQNDTFTFVTLTGTNTLNGSLVQDFYRLKYICTESDFDASKDASNVVLPTVLRAKTPYTVGTAGTMTYFDAVPNAPAYTGSGSGNGGFRTWYMIDSTNQNVAINTAASVLGFSAVDQLDSATPTLALTGEVTTLADGTEELKLYACINASGKAEIRKDAYYGGMPAVGDTPTTSIAIETDGAFTARFEVKGTKNAGSFYQLKFANQIPVGTKLTLCKRESDGTLEWYCYSTSSATDTVPVTSFIKAGQTLAASLPAGADDTDFEETLQLIVDFKDATTAAADNSVKLQMNINGTNRDVMGTELSYTVFDKAAASITAAGSDVTVALTQGSDIRLNGKHLYAVAVLKQGAQTVSVPYEATAQLGSITGKWLSGDTVIFDLGGFGDMSWTKAVSFTGLDAGSYNISWILTAAKNNSSNPYEHILNKTTDGTYTQATLTLPEMTAVLTTTTSDVLEYTGSDYTMTYTVTSNTFPVKYWVEKQTALKTYSKDTEQTLSADGTVNITIPADEGVYRVRFSINDTSSWDDVYSSFIVKQ